MFTFGSSRARYDGVRKLDEPDDETPLMTSTSIGPHSTPGTGRTVLAGVLAVALAVHPVTPLAGQAATGPTTKASAERAAATLTLDEVYDMARTRNPLLRASTAMAEAAATRVDAAGTLPDPTLQVGIMNFGVPGFETDMPMSMAPALSAMQRVPFPGKLGLSREIAGYSREMARTGSSETWWTVRAKAAAAFYGIYEVERKLAVLRKTRALLVDLEQVARSMYGTGSGRQSDVLRANVEIARMDAEIRRMEAMRTAAAARLNAVLDRPADMAVPQVRYPAAPGATPPADTLLRWAESSRPALARFRLGVEQAETRQELARRQVWPDFSLGLQYGQRPSDAGAVRMGSVMLGFSVPIHAGSRQLRLRDEAAAMQRMAEAELDRTRAEVDARIKELEAELDRARSLVALYRTDVLPQAEANVESALSSYRVGAVDFMTLVDAQMAVNRFRQELFTLLADYGRAVAEMETTIGRELPATTALVEDR